MSFDRVRPHFPEITPEQWKQLETMAALHREWNAKINLVSRKDIDNLEWHHYAPCMAAIKFLKLMDGARVIDVGTGGGFPGLILAVLYPECRFTLVDSVGKKILVVKDIVQRMKLRNVEVLNVRVETIKKEYDFVTGRAVTALPAFIRLTRTLVKKGAKHSHDNGLLYWKGGPLAPEKEVMGVNPDFTYEIKPLLENDEYFFEKYILHYRSNSMNRARVPADSEPAKPGAPAIAAEAEAADAE
jgi:16S rRNA (guanine527-N7)-methyltransferase